MKQLIEPRELAKKLIAYREAHQINGKRMTQEHLAEKIIGIHQFTLQRWERAGASYSTRISPVMFAHLKRLKIIS